MNSLIEIARSWAEDPALLAAQNDFSFIIFLFGALAAIGVYCAGAGVAFCTHWRARYSCAAAFLFCALLMVYCIAWGWTLSYANAFAGMAGGAS